MAIVTRKPQPLMDDEARAAAVAYNAHHFACPTCIAAGQGRGKRCSTGLDLRAKYGAAYRKFRLSQS